MAIQKIPGRAIELTNQAQGDVAYYNGTTWKRLAIGEPGARLTMDGDANYPQWGEGISDPETGLFQGTIRGYCAGGNNGGWSVGYRYERIDQFSFVTDGNATDCGDLVRDTYMMASSSSATHGYVMGGEFPTQNYVDVIQKWSYAADSNATNVGSISTAASAGTGHSSMVHGYHCYITSAVEYMDKWAFATDGTAADVGNLAQDVQSYGGISSTTHGYMQNYQNSDVGRFSFTSDGSSVDVGDTVISVSSPGGSSSSTHGYIHGGWGAGNSPSDHIQKLSFATEGNCTDVGNLTTTKGHTPATPSSTTHGYNCGGWMGEQNPTNIIDKFATATDGNASDVGDLWAINYGCVGAQV